MPSTNTSNLNLEKPADGEQSGEWGDTVNSNMELIDAAVATKTGSETLTNKTLTSPVLNTGASGTAIKDEDNMASDSASHLATQQSIKAYVDSQVATDESIEDAVGGMVTGNTETGIAVTYEDSDGTLDFVVSDTTVSGDTGSTGITPGDTLTIAGGTNVSTAMSGDTLTITSTDTNTQLSQEQVEDFVGGMVTGNTETGITVTYQDGDGTLDFAVTALPADDLTTGDAAVTLATSAGNITVDAQGNDTDIIFKGTDGTVDTTYLTLDGSAGGAATLNNGLTLADGNLVVAAGHGIDFSANTHYSGAGGMESELFHEYEEGNFTATLTGVGATGSVVTRGGNYTKIGRDVHLDLYFVNSNTTGFSGSIQVTGLPFAANTVNVGSCGLYNIALVSIGAFSYIGAGESTLEVYCNRDASTWLAAAHSAGTGRYMALDITYRV